MILIFFSHRKWLPGYFLSDWRMQTPPYYRAALFFLNLMSPSAGFHAGNPHFADCEISPDKGAFTLGRWEKTL